MDKWRHHAGVEALRGYLAAGLIGTPRHIRLIRWSIGNDHPDVDPLWVLAPHDLSIILHLFATLPPLAWAHPHIPGHPEFGCIAGLQGGAGVSAVIDIGVLGAEHVRRLTVTGSEGQLEMTGGYADKIVWSKAPPGTPRPEMVELPFSANMPLRDELEAFLRFLRGEGGPPHSNAHDGMAIVDRLADIDARIRA
jgi:predicted dehydrogenase